MLQFDTGVQFVKGVGPKRGALLTGRGIRRVGDLLLHFPRAYQNRAHFIGSSSLRLGEVATIHAQVYRARLIPTRSRGRILDVAFKDESGFVRAKWFNGDHLYRNKVFLPGRWVVLFGKAERDKYESGVVFFNPEFEVMPEGEDASTEEMGRYVPVYEEVAGITSRQLRTIIESALEAIPGSLHDPLPVELRERHGFPDLAKSIKRLHRPQLDDDLDALNCRRSPYHRRFIFEEFFLVELTLALRRLRLRSTDGIRFETNDSIRERLKRILPFHPTGAQKTALREIVEDLCAPHPMNRLLQGDVGSGKTIVAFETIVIAVENGYQAAMMAPTEILAEQHYINARQILEPLGYSVALIKRGVRREDEELLGRVRAGEVQVVVGTHALIEDDAAFRRLGLVVIDEQHRFGVVQRLRLMEKGRNPNTLVMTATPIPRTLAMTFYGDLDVSIIDEMPPGRIEIETQHVRERERRRVEQALGRELGEGRQSYVVYPIIEESETMDLRSATEAHERLSEVFGAENVGLLHGRMKSAEKEATMNTFAAGKIAILVATTVVEVGVDVANATLMVIEHAERFGIAQLHQLRGRVGRGAHRSRCLLVTPDRIGETAFERVRAVAGTNDGFRLAETDLRQRGPGELAGRKQSGIPEFRIANLVDDTEILVQAREETRLWIDRPAVRDRLIEQLRRHSGTAGLVAVG